MAKEKNKSFKVTGKVVYCGKSGENEKNTISIEVTEEQAKKIALAMELKEPDEGIESNPIKLIDGEDGESNIIAFKAGSKYNVDIYRNGNEITGEMELEEIGKDSEVTIFVSIGEVKYGRKKYQVAYLKSVNILSLVPHVKFNAFKDADDIESL